MSGHSLTQSRDCLVRFCEFQLLQKFQAMVVKLFQKAGTANSSFSVPTAGAFIEVKSNKALCKSTEFLINGLKEIGYAQISPSAGIAYDRFAYLTKILFKCLKPDPDLTSRGNDLL